MKSYELTKEELPHICIIIPIWNAYERTILCLSQFETWDYPKDKIEIIVQDSGSNKNDYETELLATVKDMQNAGWKINFYKLNEHPGLTKALNIALERIKNNIKYVMRLDNDVELKENSLSLMIKFLEENNDVGVIGPKIYYKKFPNKINSAATFLNKFGFKSKIIDFDKPSSCDVLLGAIMLFRISAIQKVGRWFDPELYLFAEEIEYCWQLQKKQYKTVYFPDAIAYHDTALSTGKHSKLSLYLNHRNNVIVYNRISSISVSIVRNTILAVIYLYRAIKYRDLFYLKVFWDGIVQKPLSKIWWQKNIVSKEFTYPES